MLTSKWILISVLLLQPAPSGPPPRSAPDACPEAFDRAAVRVDWLVQALTTFPQARETLVELGLDPDSMVDPDPELLTDPGDTQTCHRLREAIDSADGEATGGGRRYAFFRVWDLYFVPTKDPGTPRKEDGSVSIRDGASPTLVFDADFRLLARMMS